jgi:hypothetical protein
MKIVYIRILLTVSLFLTVRVFTYSQATCVTAATLTPSSTCTTTAGNLKNAATALPIGSCGGATALTTFGVWYKFTASATTTAITIKNLGSGLTGSFTPYLEVLNGTCAGFSVISCTTVSTDPTRVTATTTIGTTYYVRVYTTTQGTSNPTNKWDFEICIQNPPANDDCSGAISLTPGSSCSNTSTTMDLATATTGLPAGCESAGTHYDVWYKFVAGSTYEIVSISSLGANITNPELQVYSGSCGTLTSLNCGTTSVSVTGLTVGNTYYVRVSNVGSDPSSTGTAANFSICVYHPPVATYDFGKSYVNITKVTGGGTINVGDTLEIRATLVVRSLTLDSLSFLDTLHTGAGLKLVPGTIALRTNEGKIYRRDSPTKTAFTDAFDADAGYTYQNGLDTIIRINIGVGATSTARGSLTNTSRPSVFGSTCIIMATYRVVVYASYGSTINLGGGMITTKDHSSGVSTNLAFSSRNAIVYSSPGLCPNAVSASNAIGGDFNGTFGTPTGGAPLAKNRGSSVNVLGYAYANFSTNAPQDYSYGITNNTSGSGTSFTTVTTWAKPDNSSPTHRVFNVWDITGDHTGATNTAKGNRPCDTTQAVSATNPCGYMLVINSAYKTDTAFQYSVTNLCPNTYYEISAWLKNICYKCGCDSMGIGVSGAGYIPFAANDSSGVQPNLAFDINGTDYFTTGNIAYAGIYPTTQTASDSTNIWVKRGFTYLTGASQTSLTLTIRNNAPGGGGNDWAMDDISLATCLPNMQYSPSLNPTVCELNPIDINDTIRSYFSNYTYYKWQRSTDGGATWTDVTGALGPASPTWNGSAYEYITTYTVLPANTTVANSGDQYRVVVATTLANLSNSSCLFTDGVSIIHLNVLNCGPALGINFLSFSGRLSNEHANLAWITSKENEPISFTIEKSVDGTNFSSIATVNSFRNYTAGNNYYSFVDPSTVSGKAWYRIVMIVNGNKKYSRIIQLSNDVLRFELTNVINPFKNELDLEIATSENAKIDVFLIDPAGKTVMKNSIVVYQGMNSITMNEVEKLSPGMYILQIQNKGKIIARTLMKK